jgi:hypothetical protein
LAGVQGEVRLEIKGHWHRTEQTHYGTMCRGKEERIAQYSLERQKHNKEYPQLDVEVTRDVFPQTGLW